MRVGFTGFVAVTMALALVGAAAADGELTLEDAVRLAVDRDALVRNAQQALDAAKAALAREGAYTPTLSVGSRVSATTTTGLDPESAVSGTDYSSELYYADVSVPLRGGAELGLYTSASTSTTNSALRTGEDMEFTYAGAEVGASVSLPLPILRDEGVLTEGGRWEAALAYRRAELALAEARRRAVGDTVALYLAVVRAQRQAEIARASQQEAEELLRIAQAKLERGKLAEIEVMEASVSADTAAVALRKAVSAEGDARDELVIFLGLGLDHELVLRYDQTSSGGRVSEEEDELIRRALDQRADVQQLALEVRSAELLVGRAEAESRPGLSLGGGYFRSGEAERVGDAFRDLVNPRWYVGVTARTNLTGREDRAEIERARGALRLAKTEEELRGDEVRLEVRRLVRALREAQESATVLSKTVEIAEENLRIRQVQFESGLVRSIDVSQTERQLAEARGELLDAVIDGHLAAARLSLAVGEMPEVGAGVGGGEGR